MRIWSLHPKYLDSKGLVALWRETLLAKHVLEGRTKGYINHPQLIRFKQQENPLDCINGYLSGVHEESALRGYHFDKSKIDWTFRKTKIPVTEGQMSYERDHLLKKLSVREQARYEHFLSLKDFESHHIFYVVKGDIASWEIL